MPTQDLVSLTVRRVLPLAAALLSVSRLVPAVMLALVLLWRWLVESHLAGG